jgi:hypothetical protein
VRPHVYAPKSKPEYAIQAMQLRELIVLLALENSWLSRLRKLRFSAEKREIQLRVSGEIFPLWVCLMPWRSYKGCSWRNFV